MIRISTLWPRIALSCGVAAIVMLGAACRPRDESAASRPTSSGTDVEFTSQEIRRIRSHSPLPPVQDPTNRIVDNQLAAALGRQLFFDKRLSSNGQLSCATCHEPARAFTDGRPIAEGLQPGRRHTPSLWNVAYNRWYFWDGRADSLWAQALHPIESPAELGSSRLAAAHLVDGDANYRGMYERVFGEMPSLSDRRRFPAEGKPVTAADPDADETAWRAMSESDQELVNTIFVNIGKTLAAFESRLVSRRSPFDRFVEALADGDAEEMRAYPIAARRGLKLFVGKANCRSCHTGPNFTDGEFHDTRIPPRADQTAPDPGRFAGLDEARRDPFNAMGKFSDRPSDTIIEYTINNPENWGRFKTPTLRNVARTAPYMHQGQFATLTDVVRYYSTLEQAMPAGHHSETILQPLHLSEGEISDLVAFLESLTDENIDPEWLRPSAAAATNR